VLEWLFEIGIIQGLSIFFFLFVVLGFLFWRFISSVMAQNNEREQRYIDTIDNLAQSLCEVKEVKLTVEEMRKEMIASNERQENMIGKVLDKLPAKE